MAAQTGNTVNMAKLFQAVTSTLNDNRTALNTADDYNHNHGDNMVEIFEVITQAMKEKKTASPADQLAYASEILRKKSQTGSAQLYAENLKDASSLFKGQKKITTDNAMQLVQALLGSGQPATQSTPASGGADLLGSLLGGLTGTTSQSNNQAGLDVNDLLNAGMAFMQSKQSGDSNLQAIMDAVVAGSKMGSSAHRSQSGTLVANTLMQVLGQMGKK